MNTRSMQAAFEQATGQPWHGHSTIEQGRERLLWVTAWNACMDSFIEKHKPQVVPLPVIDPELLEVGE